MLNWLKRLVGSSLLAAVFVALGAGTAHAILGDLNKDGNVTFDDFFLLVDNFGQAGPPEPADTVVVIQVDTVVSLVRDTVRVTVESSALARVGFDNEANVSDWDKPDEANWRLEEGRLIITGEAGGLPTACYFPNSFSGELDIAVDATMISDGGDGEFGLVVGESGAEQFYFGINAGGSYKVYKTVEGQVTVLTDWTSSQVIVAGGINNLRVINAEDMFAFFVNGTQVSEIGDVPFFFGRIGLMVQEVQEVGFDNFSIDRPEQVIQIERTVRDTVELVRRDTIREETTVEVEKIVEVEVIVEKIVEVPVEVFVRDTVEVQVTVTVHDTVLVQEGASIFEIQFTLINAKLDQLSNVWAAMNPANLTDSVALDLLGFIVPEVNGLVTQTQALVPPGGDQEAAEVLGIYTNFILLHQQFFTLLKESIEEQNVDKANEAIAKRDAINEIDQDIFDAIEIAP